MSVVEFREVSHRYTPARIALQGITLSVAAGERVGLIGASGAGKSTLLRAINGLVSPTEGRVQVLGEEVEALNEADRMRLRRRVGMIFQEFALIERLPVLTNVLVGRLGYVKTLPSLFRLFPSADVERARRALEEVGLREYEDRLVRQLSGGQKQRVGIARALAQEPALILGDEPTANLDIRTADEVLSLLVRLADEHGVTLILSLHDVRAARRFCTRIVALRAGCIVWNGPAPQFSDAELERVFY
jgi:phosphonate transport system ATP-binding protein